MCATGESSGCNTSTQCVARYRHTAPAQNKKPLYRARNIAANPLNRILQVAYPNPENPPFRAAKICKNQAAIAIIPKSGVF